jgi:hypothetical protein
MPQRSNVFQRLVATIQSHMDPGATVTESALLRDLVTGAQREVDVVVSGQVARHPVEIAIECRDRGRRSDVTWVEEMHAKHSRLPTNVLVLASHSEFTREACRVAELYGIRRIVLDDIDRAAPERLFPDVQSLWGKAWEVSIDRVSITVEATSEVPAEQIRAVPDNVLFLDDGTEIGHASQLANALARSEPFIQKMWRDATPEHKVVEFSWEPVVDRRVCLQKTEPLMLRRIERFHVVASCRVTVNEFPLRHGRYGSVRVAWGEGEMLGKPTLLVATDDLLGTSKISLKILGSDTPR